MQIIYMKTVDITFYIIVAASINSNGWTTTKPTVRVSKGKPNLRANEVPVKVSLSLPTGLFLRPTLTASVKVPEAMSFGSEIPTEIQHNVVEAIKQATGMEVKLVVEGKS